jgi:FkbM family methyltransferase
MNLIASLRKPEYVFHPARIWNRIVNEFINPLPENADVLLPWGHLIRVRPREAIGACIWRVGIYDVCVSECLWRLMDPGEVAVDIGANIGHMTSVMASRAGKQGKIISVEPHPELFEELHFNVSRWQSLMDVPDIVLHNLALSDRPGRALLHIPHGFRANRGTASLLEPSGQETERESHPVDVNTLDALLYGNDKIGVLKIDVEGHELAVLQGSMELLRNGHARDIIFEEHGMPPTPVIALLRENGYVVFHMGQRLRGPEILDIRQPYIPKVVHPPSFLATIDPQRALARLSERGWRVLRRVNGSKSVV